MTTHGHGKGSTTYWGLLGEEGRDSRGGELGRGSMGRNAKCG